MNPGPGPGITVVAGAHASGPQVSKCRLDDRECVHTRTESDQFKLTTVVRRYVTFGARRLSL